MFRDCVTSNFLVKKWNSRNAGECPVCVGQCTHGYVSVRQSALFSCLGAQISRQMWRPAAQLSGTVKTDFPWALPSACRGVCGDDGSGIGGARRTGTADSGTTGGTAGHGAEAGGTTDRGTSRGGTAVSWRSRKRWEGDAWRGAAEERHDSRVCGSVRKKSPVCRVAYGHPATRQVCQHLPSCQQEEG